MENRKRKLLGTPADPLQALRNAKAQGALVQFNHPGTGRTSLDLTEFVRVDSKGRKVFNLTNMSSLPFAVSISGSNPAWIEPFSTVPFKVESDTVVLDYFNHSVWKNCPRGLSIRS